MKLNNKIQSTNPAERKTAEDILEIEFSDIKDLYYAANMTDTPKLIPIAIIENRIGRKWYDKCSVDLNAMSKSEFSKIKTEIQKKFQIVILNHKDVIKKMTKTYQKLVIRNMGECGHGIFAKDLIENGRVFLYPGNFELNKKKYTKSDNALVAASDIHLAVWNPSANMFGITSLFQHAPCKDELKNYFIDIDAIHRDQISTANLELYSFGVFLDESRREIPLFTPIFITTRDIQPGEMLALDYSTYWNAVNELPMIFDKTGTPLKRKWYVEPRTIDIALSNDKNLRVRMTGTQIRSHLVKLQKKPTRFEFIFEISESNGRRGCVVYKGNSEISALQKSLEQQNKMVIELPGKHDLEKAFIAYTLNSKKKNDQMESTVVPGTLQNPTQEPKFTQEEKIDKPVNQFIGLKRLNNQAVEKLKNKEYKKAINLFKIITEKLENVKSPTLLMLDQLQNAFFGIGTAHMELSELTTALEFLKKAEELQESTGKKNSKYSERIKKCEQLIQDQTSSTRLEKT